MRRPIDRIAMLSVFAGTANAAIREDAIAVSYQPVLICAHDLAGFSAKHFVRFVVFVSLPFHAGPGHLCPLVDRRQPFAVAFAKLGSMYGNDKSEQQARGYEGFHGLAPHLGDAGDGLDGGITGHDTFDVTTRTDRASAQYPLLQRRVFENTSANAKLLVALGVKPVAGLYDVNPDTPGAGFGMGGRDKGEQQRCGNEGFHLFNSFCVEA